MLGLLARQQLGGHLKIAPLGITSTSETLTADGRALIARAFSVPVTDTFGSTEGLFAATPPDDRTFDFSSDICIVELVDEDHRAVPPGTPSAKILVTNLVNRTQPLIRYVMADRFVRMPDSPVHGHLRATVEGRSDEIFRYPDVDVHPIVVRSVLVKTPSVLDYQVRQTARGIEVSVVGEASSDFATLQGQLVVALRTAGLAEPEVRVDIAPALRRHHQTGKLSRFVPLSA
jgi:phenylacetate-coenzyme A ligase PaaK-like adenylate-forming protein